MCYQTFLITADVPTIYINQSWDTMYKHGSSYRFKIDSCVHRIRSIGHAGKSRIATALFNDKNSYVASADQCHSSSKFGGHDLRSGNNNSNDSFDYYAATNSYGTLDYGAPSGYGNNASHGNDFRLRERTI
ncbi:hypothetical protein Tco_1362773 [Tanacetum coccineum]